MIRLATSPSSDSLAQCSPAHQPTSARRHLSWVLHGDILAQRPFRVACTTNKHGTTSTRQPILTAIICTAAALLQLSDSRIYVATQRQLDSAPPISLTGQNDPAGQPYRPTRNVAEYTCRHRHLCRMAAVDPKLRFWPLTVAGLGEFRTGETHRNAKSGVDHGQHLIYSGFEVYIFEVTLSFELYV